MIFLKVLEEHINVIYKNESIGENGDWVLEILNSIKASIGSKSRGYHLTLGENDKEFFEEIITKGKNVQSQPQKKSQKRLQYTYEFFNKKIDGLISNYSLEEMIKELDKIVQVFLEHFTVLYMEASELGEAFTIFETLNARGRDLETADLLKNFIFQQLNEKIGFAEDKWRSMLSCLDQSDTTKYIRHFWNSNHNFTREKQLYKNISSSIKDVSKKDSALLCENLINDLEKYASFYHFMDVPSEEVNPFDNDKIRKKLDVLKTLKATTFYPLILAMLENDYSKDDINDVLETVEKYIFRNFTICKDVANATEMFFAKLALAVSNKTIKKDEIIKSIKNEMEPDEVFKTKFEFWTGTKSNKDIIRYILRKIHQHLATNEVNRDNSEVHIEHIMPENIKNWDVDKDTYNEYLWRLGNLMLLDGKLNIENSNKIFKDKIDNFVKSEIKPNNEMSKYHEWGPSEINDRQKRLAELAIDIWNK